MSQAQPNAWAAFWQTVILFQSSKVNPWLALRNTVGVTLPLVAGVAAGNPSVGIAVATGALNVSFSDGEAPYTDRAKRMLAASSLVGVAVFIGSISGHHTVSAAVAATAWAFAAGMLVSLSPAAGDVGVISLVTLVVFAGTPLPFDGALTVGALAFCGGLLQTFLSLLFWPIRRYAPESRALGAMFQELARAARHPIDATQSPPATSQSTEAHGAVSSLVSDHSVESERLRLLLSQAERIRLGLLTLTRLQVRIGREIPGGPEIDALARFIGITADMLDGIGASMLGRDAARIDCIPECQKQLQTLTETLRTISRPESQAAAATLRDALFQMDAVAGQLRTSVDLAASSTPAGIDAFHRREARRPWTLRIGGAFATLAANFSFRSATFRHALRLAACVGIGEALGRGLGLGRSYWIPMTIAIILKPDFTATYSRGALRFAGTFAGLLVATALTHLLPRSAAMNITLLAVMLFLVRWLGPANYGVFSTAITALVVFLFALAGIAPNDVIVARGINTVAGGALALVAYAIWPTWERTQIAEAIARLLDGYREYARAIGESYQHPEAAPSAALDRVRVPARLARSNLEASIDRLLAEPGATNEVAVNLSGLLASSHRVVHAMMALEAGLYSSNPAPPRAAFAPFGHGVELTLYYLAAALRGSSIEPADLPDLREAHRALIHSGDALTERYALVNVETDRITNSLNTLTLQVFTYLQPHPARPAE